MNTMLEIKNLRIYFRSDGEEYDIRAVDGVTFSVEKGEIFDFAE